jgi:hypothetical protein
MVPDCLLSKDRLKLPEIDSIAQVADELIEDHGKRLGATRRTSVICYFCLGMACV